MKVSLARYAVAVVVIGAIAAAVFRVSTAPDRVRQRLETARQVCVSSGGEWVTVEREPMCVKSGTALAR